MKRGFLALRSKRRGTFVEFDPMLGTLEASKRQSELARCLMALLKLGEMNPTSLANSGIAMLRKNQTSSMQQNREPSSVAG
jgi:hypothetical protein